MRGDLASGSLTSLTPAGRPAHGFAHTPVDLEAEYTPPVVDPGDPRTTHSYNTDR